MTRIRFHAATAALLASALCASLAHGREVVEAVAAQVGGGIVLLSEVQELSKPIEQRMRDGGAREAEIAMMRTEVLDRLIEQKLIADVVRRLELGASDEEVDAAIQSIAQDTGITPQQLVRSVTSHGLTLDEYRDKIRQEIERSKVIQGMVRSQVRIEPAEIDALYEERFADQPSGGEEVHLRHIIVAYGESLLRDGDAACELAREGRRWIHLGDVAAWMAPTVRELGASGISDVIEMPFGCNLVQVVQRRDFEPVTLEQATPRLEQELGQVKTEQAFVKWIDGVREETYIERKGEFAESSRLTRDLGGGGGRP